MVQWLFVACRKDDPTPPADTSTDPSPPPVTTTSSQAVFGAAGGIVAAEGFGAVDQVFLSLAKGALPEGVEATVSLAARELLHAEHSDLFGAAHQMGLDLTVTPPDLGPAVLEALQIEVQFDLHAPDVAVTRDLLETDVVAWAGQFLFSTGVAGDDVADFDLEVCSPPPKADRIVEVHNFGNSQPGVRPGIGLITTQADATLFKHAEVASEVGTYQGEIWVALKPYRSLSTTHPHLGDYRVTYYPVSALGTEPLFPVESDPAWADPTLLDPRLGCVVSTVDAVLGTLSSKGYPPIAGQGRPFDILVYDYTTSTTTFATASYTSRFIQLRSDFMDPALTADACRPEVAAEKLFAVAHEVYHWQAESMLFPQSPVTNWSSLKDSYLATVPVSIAGPYDLPAPVRVKPNLWWSEAMAQYFAYELVRSYPFDGWVKYGLTSFPLHTDPWYESDEILYLDSGRWGYRRYPYFKYLFDVEDGGPNDELVEQRELMEFLAADFVAQGAGVAPGASIDLSDAIFTHGDAIGRDWFGFLREMALLRGCASAGTCPLVEAHQSNPFGHNPSPFTDLYGISDDGTRYWDPFSDVSDPYLFDELPFDPPEAGHVLVDGDRTMLHTTDCRLDTVIPAYTVLSLSADAVRLATDSEVVIALPINVQYPLVGTRIDVLDDLVYAGGRTYTWEWSLDAATCELALRSELWRWQEDPASMSRVGVAAATGDLATFDTAEPDAIGVPQMSVLVGNESTDLPMGEPGLCLATLRVRGCPCDDLEVGQDPEGDPGDDVLFCLEGGESLVLCDDAGFYVDGLLDDVEYTHCFEEHGEMSSYCGLGPAPP